LTNTELATLLTNSEECKQNDIEVKPLDIAQQKQAMKKPGATMVSAPAVPATPEPAASPTARNGRKKGGRKPGRKPRPAPVARPTTAATDVVVHIEAIREAVKKLGADQVRRIVGLFE